MFSPSAYSEALVDLPTDLLQHESARLSNELHKEYHIPRPKSMTDTIFTKIQLIDLEILRRDKAVA